MKKMIIQLIIAFFVLVCVVSFKSLTENPEVCKDCSLKTAQVK